MHGIVSCEPLFQLEDCCASLVVVLLLYCIFWPLGLSLSKMLKTPNYQKNWAFTYITSASKVTWLYYLHKVKMRPKMLCHNAHTFGENQTIVQCKAANKNWEAITVFVDVFLQHWWKKNSSFFLVFSFYFLNAQSDNNRLVKFMFLVIKLIYFGPFSEPIVILT